MHSLFPAQFVEAIILIQLFGLSISVKNQLAVHIEVNFWSFSSVPLIGVLLFEIVKLF